MCLPAMNLGACGLALLTLLSVAAASVAPASAAAPANEVDPWLDRVEQTLAETCAIRKLPIKRPVSIQPMKRFEGGYTKGIGSTVWETEYASAWRDGWCALGIYCAPKGDGPATGDAADEPRGLYDHTANVLYVDPLGDETQSIVAHELVHALQHQNFPALDALHLWYNRDLAAAGNTSLEGGAHVVGWAQSTRDRTRLCLMAPEDRATRRARWWNWNPEDFRAHEIFPHAFGPEAALEALLARGTAGLDALLDDPPLSTLALLRPSLRGPVDFIKLPHETLSQVVSDKNCVVGLTNTAGAVGIWGLLRLHGDATGSDPPRFIDDWTGDRFVHLACPGEDNDELAWLTRWGTAEAASEFAARFRRIAPRITRHGGVLGTHPVATPRGRTVVVATPGLSDVLDPIMDSEVRSFSRYRDWIASGCFPQDVCYEPRARTAPADGAMAESAACSVTTEPSTAFSDWFESLKRARDPSNPRVDDPNALAEAAGRLGVFCAVNTARNTDLKTACRAGYGGVSYLARLENDSDWRLLPHCLEGDEFRRWIRDTFYADADRSFASPAVVPSTHGPALAAAILRREGSPGLDALLASPPLSALRVLRPASDPLVEFIRMPRDELAARGCHVYASDSEGVLGIWNLLMDYGQVPEEDALPRFLLDWLGDRRAFIGCGDDPPTQGWVWTSRWRTSEAAATFVDHYRALDSRATDEASIPTSAQVEEARGTVWLVPPELAGLASVLMDSAEVRSFTDFRDWVDGGCFPQSACN